MIWIIWDGTLCCKTEWIMVNQWSFTGKIENWCLCFINKILCWLYLRQFIKISIPQSFCVVWINLNFHILSYRHSVVGIYYISVANLLSVFFFSYWFFWCLLDSESIFIVCNFRNTNCYYFHRIHSLYQMMEIPLSLLLVLQLAQFFGI